MSPMKVMCIQRNNDDRVFRQAKGGKLRRVMNTAKSKNAQYSQVESQIRM
jgi:hypothetical protein